VRSAFVSWALAGLLLLGGAGRGADDSPGDLAIRGAIEALRAKKAQAGNKADRDKIDRAITALERVLAQPAVAPDAEDKDAFPLTPELLKDKFHGRATYNAKTGELSLAYDFRNRNQLKDFDLDGANPWMANGAVEVLGQQKFTHVAKFLTLTATAEVAIGKPLGFYLGTSQDLQLYIHDNWSIELWLDGQLAARNPLPPAQQRKPMRVVMTVEPKRFSLQAGSVKLAGSVTDKARGGQVVLMGGHNDGAQFRNLVITGKPDPEWAKTFFGP
jgi:hypothetical protein